MRMRALSVAGVAWIVALMACASRTAVVDAPVVAVACAIDSAWQQPGREASFDERVAFQIGTYSGMYRDAGASGDSIRNVVLLTDVEAAPEVVPILRRELERYSRANVPRFRFRRAKYSYRELRSFLECYIRGAGARHLSGWSVDISQNQVTLSIPVDTLRARVVEEIRRLRSPRDAFDIRTMVVKVGARPTSARLGG